MKYCGELKMCDMYPFIEIMLKELAKEQETENDSELKREVLHDHL